MNHDYAKSFRIIRAAFGLQQAELAARMSISPSQLSLIESGRRQPSLRVVNALASAVDVPAAIVTLLASPANDVTSKADSEISDLARALLKLLVSAQEDPQQSLKLSG